MKQSQQNLQKNYGLFLTPEKFIERHGKLQVIEGQKSPSTIIFKSFDNKLVRRIVFQNEDDFRQWLPCLKFEINKQNDMAKLYPEHILQILDYAYEICGNEFRFYITYNCNPDQFKPLFYEPQDSVSNKHYINDTLKILEIGIILRNAQVCHNNMKPSNLLICRNNLDGKSKILLTDFGSMRTIQRNYKVKYTKEEEKKWQNDLLFYQCHAYQQAYEQQKQQDNWLVCLKPNETDADIWALGIIILQFVQRDSSECKEPLQQYYQINKQRLQSQIKSLTNNQPTRFIAESLESLLLNKGDIRKVYQTLHKNSSRINLAENFLKCSKKLIYDQSFLYTINLKAIKDVESDLQGPSQLIEPPSLLRADTSISSRIDFLIEINNLVKQVTQVSNDVPNGQEDSQIIQFEELDSEEESHHEINQNIEQNLEISEPQINKQNVQQKLNNFFFFQSADNLLFVSEFKFIDSVEDQEKYLAQLFDLSLTKNSGQYRSTLNYILEHNFKDVDMQAYRFFILEEKLENDSDILTQFITQQKVNIPLCYLSYLKQFPNLLGERKIQAYTLNKLPHGLGTRNTQDGLFQGIFHQGKLLWGTLFQFKVYQDRFSLFKMTGPFNQKTQRIDGDDCDIEVYQYDENQFIKIEQYKGGVVDGKSQGKGVKLFYNKNLKYIGEWKNGAIVGCYKSEYIDKKKCNLYSQQNLQQKKGNKQEAYDTILRKQNNQSCRIF